MAVLLFQKFRVGIFKKIPSSEQEIKQGAKGVKIRFERRLLASQYFRSARSDVLEAEQFERQSGETAVDQPKHPAICIRDV